MQQTLPWVLATAACLLLVLAALLWLVARPRRRAAPLPSDWALAARPVFTSDERRVYKQLRELLPQHVILAKLPLVRLCQPTDPAQVRYWYDLIGAAHVSFAICSGNGRVLAAIDLDQADRGNSRRVQQIKQSVLNACRVRYLRCAADQLPTAAELQLLVPQPASAPVRVPQTAPATMAPGAAAAPVSIDRARENLANTVATRRRERSAMWQESVFNDSFFGNTLPAEPPPGEPGGAVVDNPPPARH